MTRIGVLALQGAFIEHVHMLRRVGAEAVEVRRPEQLAGLDGLIIPGGESTTIGKLAVSAGLVAPLRDFARQRPTWGTCAGMIFLARALDNHEQPLLGLMDITVDRNAFGRQLDSFEAALPIPALGEPPWQAVFIRAPVVSWAGGGVGVVPEVEPQPRAEVVSGEAALWIAAAWARGEPFRLHGSRVVEPETAEVVWMHGEAPVASVGARVGEEPPQEIVDALEHLAAQ